MFKSKEDFTAEELAEELFQLAEKAYQYGSPWHVGQFLSDLKNPHSRYLLLTKGAVIGYIGFQQVLDEGEISNVVMDPAYQGQGYAQKLFAAFKEYYGEQLQKVFLEVRVSNLTAQRLYRRVGFEVLGKRKNYYHDPIEDAVIMVLEMKAGIKE